jgi:transcriptional regulator with XRE-family HTH domain
MSTTQKIKERRQLLRLSQKQVAERLFISQRAFSRLERGEKDVTVVMLVRLSAVLECPARELLPE